MKKNLPTNCCKALLASFLLLLTLHTYGQGVDVFDPYKDEWEQTSKNILKTNVFAPFARVYGLSYERWINNYLSVELAGSLLRTSEAAISTIAFNLPVRGVKGSSGYHGGVGAVFFNNENGLGDLIGVGIRLDYRSYAPFPEPTDFHARGWSAAMFVTVQNDDFNYFIVESRLGIAYHQFQFSKTLNEGTPWFYFTINLGLPV